MPAVVFVDTNVLVYVRDAADQRKQAHAREWMKYLWQSRSGRVSTQVLQEYFWVTTQKLKPGLPVEDARQDIRELLAWSPICADAKLLESAWALQDRYAISWWDSLIVAAAEAAASSHLLTEDLADGQVYGTVRVVSPFAHTPGIVDENYESPL